MGLRVSRLRLQNFRSYGSLDLEPDERITIIVGPNAVGKTNIIEALQLLTATTSFRNPVWGDCVKWGSREASLSLCATGADRSLETALHISLEGKRLYRVNGSVKRRISDVAGHLPSVVFTPDDLRVVKDSAERRRGAIDSVGDQLSAAYRTLRGEFEKTLRQRNAALRTPLEDVTLLETLSESLIDRGEAFGSRRRRLFERLSVKATAIYESLAPDETLEAVYEPSWVRRGINADKEGAFREALQNTRAEERARGTTVVGPHRDDIRFLLDGREARAYASQGQQRTIALAWKLAEVSVITDVGSQPPILLLDDVMSEFDGARRHALTSFVGEVAQTFVTTTNLGYFEPEMVDGARVVKLP